MSYIPRLKKEFNEAIVPHMMEKFEYSSVMEVPRITKICINQGVGAATQDRKLVDSALEELTLITGQKAVPTVARKSVSNFKLREGMVIGAKVTLRSEERRVGKEWRWRVGREGETENSTCERGRERV